MIATMNNKLYKAIGEFLSYHDDHGPGEFIKDGNWHYGPCIKDGPRMEDIYPNGFQYCIGEDCGDYWPCSFELLRRTYIEYTNETIKEKLLLVLDENDHKQWFSSSIPALGGSTPKQLIERGEGEKVLYIVNNYLECGYV